MKRLPFALATVAILLAFPVAASAQTVVQAQGGFFNDSRSCSDNAFNYWQTNYFDKNISAAAVKTYCGCNLTIAQQQPTCNITMNAALGSKYAWKFDIKLTQLAAPGGSSGASGSGVPGASGSGVPGASGSGPSVQIINPLQGGDLMTFLKGILDVVIRIGTIVIVLMLVYIGFLFATTSVNPENKVKAREALLWTVIGALILLGAQAIATGIQETVNALSAGS